MGKVLIPSNSAESEFVERKSRFISKALPVSDPDSIRSIIKETRISHPQSRHVVWAYILGDSRSIFGLSDDGEPHGTAGKPVLEVLKGSGLTDILILVIRYFGGVKLGTGGLVSAYTRSAQEVLSQVKPLEKISRTAYSLNCSYHYFDHVKKILIQNGGDIQRELFETEVTLEVELPDDRTSACAEELRDLSAGSVELLKKE